MNHMELTIGSWTLHGYAILAPAAVLAVLLLLSKAAGATSGRKARSRRGRGRR
jgi:hypothetical protein